MAEIYSEVLERHGLQISGSVVSEIFPVVWKELDCLVPSGVDRFTHHPGGARGWWQRLLERLCELAEAPAPSKFAAVELYGRFAGTEPWEVFPEVEEVLAALRSDGMRLGVVANWDERLPKLLEELGLGCYFDAVVCSSSLGAAKPDAAIFLAALEKLGVSAGSAMHVGDSPREDVEGALAVGMSAALVDRRVSAAQRSADAGGASEPLLCDLRGLPELLLERR